MRWVIAFVCLSASCATVGPYERETLMRRDMSAENETMARSEAQSTRTREGASPVASGGH